MRKLFGIGKPRTLQDLADLAALMQILFTPCRLLLALRRLTTPPDRPTSAPAATA